MYRVVIALAFCILSFNAPMAAQRGFSPEEIAARAEVLNIHSDSLISKTRIALSGLSELIKRNLLTEQDAYDLFNDVAADIGGVRAILFVAPDGALKYDSSLYPPAQINLKTREYFKVTARSVKEDIIISAPVQGKLSKTNFIPITYPVRNEGVFLGVLVAAITPTVFIPKTKFDECLHCIGIITDLSGVPLAQYPETTDLSNFADKLKTNERQVVGSDVIDIGFLKANISWVRNKNYPIISVFLEFKRD